MLRTHTCGELRLENVGQSATLCGWVVRCRDHGNLAFVDLRDRYGITQVVFNPSHGEEMHALARSLRSEDVIRVIGEVVPRREQDVNPKVPTGQIDVRAHTLEVLNKSKTPPFEPGTADLPNEELRLRYRFIDLRRPALQANIMLRHRITKLVRQSCTLGCLSRVSIMKRE